MTISQKQADWHSILRDAFSRNVVYGLFIDYQEMYYSIDVHPAFVKGARLHQALHSQGIESMWAAVPCKIKTTMTATFNDTVLHRGEKFKIAQPAPDEMVYLKYGRSVFKNEDAAERLKTMTRPVLIAGGVYATKCFGASVMDALHLSNCDVIIALDATNFTDFEETTILSRMCNFERLHQRNRLGHYHVTTSQEIIDALRCPNKLAHD